MTREEYTNMLLPKVMHDRAYYEEKYKKRNLPNDAMVTRIGPSPTGFVHIGTLYQAIVANRLAKQSGGVCFLRVEDTDQKREVEGAIEEIIEGLKHFELMPDEGVVGKDKEIGHYGPYTQSKRGDIYRVCAKHLIEIGRAYPCFCTQEMLQKTHDAQVANKVIPGYYGVYAKCRNISIDESIERVKRGEKFILRFRSNGSHLKKITFKDDVKGKIEMADNDEDIVIIKSDGLPTYHFAHAIDDHLMRTTHVIRGDEWLSSVPLHLQLFYELGFKAPKYAHIAPIMKNDNGNKRKLSKRKDEEAAVSYYEEQGIPEEAVKEYLLNIANSTFENWRRANPDKDISEFQLQINKMSVSGALFDMVKLLDVGKTVISKFTAEKVYNEALKWAKRHDSELEKVLEDKEYSLKVFGIERGNKKPRKDIAKWSDVKDNIEYMYDELFYSKKQDYPYQVINNKEEIEKILNLYIEKYYDENDDKQMWFDKIKELSGELGYAKEVKEFKENPGKYTAHVGDVSTVLRVALTSRTNTPDMYEIMKILGKKRIEERFKKAIES